MKVVVQIKDLDKVTQALRSVINLYNDINDAEIEVVFHQSAIKALLKDSETRSVIEDLMNKKNINIVGCENSIRSQNLSHDQLIPGIKIVTSGVGEIVRKQSEGWVYLVL
ncbi:sulfur reductase DrsE [Sulfolobus sp. S-194]|uniref:DsrE family protein n=1 Tax=Sulfolobus sp. S-194 TaxID=2512240 RepID=UPI0014370AE4|nr:DsrE family protein [Sulfolobus sp. S-194]QIW22989.1 sulfur reductase DrsE [Sulfolobus sp. S-194]